MKLSYQLEEVDFLTFQLFAASKSGRIARRRKRGRILMPLLLVGTGMLFYSKGNTAMAAYFWALSVLVFLLYFKYLNWRYRKHYRAYVRENFTSRFGQQVELEITPKHIYSRDPSGEGKVKTSEIYMMSETNAHFFIQLASGMAVIIPKEAIESIERFKKGLKAVGIKLDNDLSWRGTLTG